MKIRSLLTRLFDDRHPASLLSLFTPRAARDRSLGERMLLAGGTLAATGVALALATTASTLLLQSDRDRVTNLMAKHFAEDALTAAHSGDDTARMRALLNRGIALLSKGHVEDARSIFEQVLADPAKDSNHDQAQHDGGDHHRREGLHRAGR